MLLAPLGEAALVELVESLSLPELDARANLVCGGSEHDRRSTSTRGSRYQRNRTSWMVAERIEDKQQESAEMLAANTAIRDGNGKLLAELTKSHTKLNDDFRTLCGTITQFMKDHGGRGK